MSYEKSFNRIVFSACNHFEFGVDVDYDLPPGYELHKEECSFCGESFLDHMIGFRYHGIDLTKLLEKEED